MSYVSGKQHIMRPWLYLKIRVLGNDTNTTKIQLETNAQCIFKNLVQTMKKIKSVHKIYKKEKTGKLK